MKTRGCKISFTPRSMTPQHTHTRTHNTHAHITRTHTNTHTDNTDTTGATMRAYKGEVEGERANKSIAAEHAGVEDLNAQRLVHQVSGALVHIEVEELVEPRCVGAAVDAGATGALAQCHFAHGLERL